ncbi:MAG: zinc-ribbon domain-containing protein [Bacillota bacterium]
MYCSKCGNQIADGSRFCSFCGTPVAEAPSYAPEPQAPETTPEPEPETVRRPFIEDINWNVNEYPTTDTIEKTDDIDFDWGMDPAEIRERLTKGYSEAVKAEINEKADALNVEDLIPARPEPEVYAAPEGEEISAADKIEKFYTFSRKNEEFQQLLNREYDKIRGGNLIEKEKEMAEKAAMERFESREEDSSMEAFLNREGVNKPYEPKAFESDVLERIEAHERALAQAKAEEEARRRMIEEERAKAAEEMRLAEEARIRAEEEERERMAREARALAEAEVRRAEEAARLAAEEAARAEEEAVRLEAEAAAKLAAEQETRKLVDARLAREAVEEARLKTEERERAEAAAMAIAEEEARVRAEAEARAKAEEEARLAAEEAERRRAAEERALLEKAEERRAQQQADKIRAQQEARQAATEKEKRIAEIERRRQEEEDLRNSLSRKQENLSLQAESAAAAEEARKVLAQTAKMREEEAAKIRAAIAGLKGETIEEEPPAPAVPETPAPAAPEVPAKPEGPAEPTIQITPEMFREAEAAAAAAAVDRPTIVPKPAPAAAPEPTIQMTREEAARMDAHRATQADLSKMAQARAQFLAEFGIDPISGKAPEAPAKPAEPVPATVEELLGEKPVTGRETMIGQAIDNIQTKTVSKEDVLRGLEHTRRISKEELKAAPVIPAEELEAEPLGIEEIHHSKTVEEMLEEISSPVEATELGAVMLADHAEETAAAAVPDFSAGEATEEEPETPAPETAAMPSAAEAAAQAAPAEPVAAEPVAAEPETVAEGFVAKEEPTVIPDEVASEGLKPGLNDTMVMTGVDVAPDADDSFKDYGEKEAEELRQIQSGETEAAAAAPAAAATAAPADTKKAAKEAAKKEKEAAKEAAKQAKEAAKMEKAAKKEAAKKTKSGGGAGRVILKILLIFLIVIFAVELAGIAIKWLAPDSAANDAIDKQLNKIIHLITGSEPDYQIPGIDYEV